MRLPLKSAKHGGVIPPLLSQSQVEAAGQPSSEIGETIEKMRKMEGMLYRYFRLFE
jgi:hypothetical protein